jgi:hypothetical protein
MVIERPNLPFFLIRESLIIITLSLVRLTVGIEPNKTLDLSKSLR